MTLNEYQRKAFATAQIDWENPRRRNVPLFGAVGELGSVVTELKKTLRDGPAYTEWRQNVAEEFGDVLWYLAAIASRMGLPLERLAGKPTKARRTPQPYEHIYRLVGTFAELVITISSVGFEPNGRNVVLATRVLRNAVRAALIALQQERLDLETVLQYNLRKVRGMFGPDAIRPARRFDAKYPEYERLPRKIAVQFLERTRGNDRVEVVLRVNDLNIGDRLTDNAAKDDGYRFHDAFHLAYAAMLGWSPVVRATFRCKRKSNSKIDEVEDGARAAIIEEAVAQTVFDYARDHSMLKGLDRIDHGILRVIQRMVRGLEVERCGLWEWQRAILVGFEAFRSLRAHRGGWLILNAETRMLAFSRDGPVAD
jgi:NTP pyrophosphatase (non-canonical NTP hydrolase)